MAKIFYCLLGWLLLSAPASAQLQVVAAGHSGPVQARVGDPVELGLRLRGRALPEGTRVRWLRVVPRLQHVETPPPNAGNATYSNAVMLGPRHGEWLGMDDLEYELRPLEAGTHVEVHGTRLVLRGAPPPRRSRAGHRSDPRAGTIFVAAEITLPGGDTLRTAALEEDRLGLSPRVMRVSYRTGDDFLGWMSSFFDVPYVFGSTPGQVERYVGVDCADSLVGALRRSTGGRQRYTSVGGIGRLAESVGDVLIQRRGERVLRSGDGEPVTLRWGEDVRAGDLLAIDYADDPDGDLPRAWDHIGVLLEDRGPGGRPDGILGGDDLLRHMGLRGLTDEALAGHGSVRLQLWRWKRRALRGR